MGLRAQFWKDRSYVGRVGNHKRPVLAIFGPLIDPVDEFLLVCVAQRLLNGGRGMTSSGSVERIRRTNSLALADQVQWPCCPRGAGPVPVPADQGAGLPCALGRRGHDKKNSGPTKWGGYPD